VRPNPRTGRLRPALSAGAFLAAALWGGGLLAGCDQHSDGATGEVAFDLAPLFRTADGEPCVSVVETLELTVTEPDGSEQVVVRQLAADDAEVRISVAVGSGRVRFDAAVRSNNGTLLYSGTQTADVGGSGFRVQLPVTAVNAVLRACPAPASFVFVDGGFEGEFYLYNRGSREVDWVASPCQADPFLLEVCEGSVEPGSHDLVYGWVRQRAPSFAFAITVRITSEVGTLDVQFTTDTARPAPPSALLGGPDAARPPALLAEAPRQRPLPLPSVTLTPWTPSP
jgi:hypothetical protein